MCITGKNTVSSPYHHGRLITSALTSALQSQLLFPLRTIILRAIAKKQLCPLLSFRYTLFNLKQGLIKTPRVMQNTEKSQSKWKLVLWRRFK